MNTYLAQLTGVIWAMDPEALEQLARRLADDSTIAAMASRAQEGEDVNPTTDYSVSADGVATIPVRGALMNSVPWIYQALDIPATAYGDVIKAITGAMDDADVRSITLSIDSPGGMISGIHGASDFIASARQGDKPITAHIMTLGASAAYWIASQAQSVTATRGARVGSIGAYTVRVDMSRAAENAGVTVHVVSSGKYKGAGVPGAPVTDDQLAQVQKEIDDMCAEFVSDIVRGRGMTPQEVSKYADGRVWSAGEAKSIGLIDDIASSPTAAARKIMNDKDQKKRQDDVYGLIEKHPAHAKLIIALDKAGNSAEAIVASVEKAEAEAKVAAEMAQVRADLTAAKAESDKKDAEIRDLKTKLAEVTAKYEPLAAVAKGADEANKVKSEPAPKSVRKITAEAYGKLTNEEKAAAGKAMAAGGLIIEG